jgi:EmrB/QacA subfamily drug resistance transporter
VTHHPAAPSGAAEFQAPALNRAIPLVLAVALFMETMDSTIISTALPSIAADIGTNPIALKLALTSYFVSLAIFIPVSGWMADRYGARRVFRAAILVFVVGSVACAMAGSLLEFVGARFLQGMGGAMMTPVGRLILVRSTPRAQLVSAMAWLTMPALIGPLLGSPVGGFITTFFSWHWIFIINVPIGLIGVVLSGWVLPEMPGGNAGRIDWPGFFLAGVAASGVVFGLSVISMPALPPVVGAVTLVLGIVAAAAYVRHVRRTPAPILDIRLFANPVLRISILAGIIFRIGIGAAPFLLPLMFQLGFGMNPLESGLLTFATAVGAMSVKVIVGWMLKRMGFRIVLIIAIATGSLLIAAPGLFTPQTPYWLIIATLILMGFARAMFFTSSNALLFADIDERQMAQASALASVSQQVSIAMGVAVAGMLLEAHHVITGQELDMAAFSMTFFVVGALSALALIPLFQLAPDAGNNISGHTPKTAASSKG